MSSGKLSGTTIQTVSYKAFEMSNGPKAYEANYSFHEEIANAVTHGLACALSIAGLVLLILFALRYTDSVLTLTSVIIFGASLILLYLTSTLYHAIPFRRTKRILQQLDHSMIYVLIAGSYTPFCLVVLNGITGIALLTFVWTVAIVGIAFQHWLLQKSDWLNCGLYLVMGWAVLPCIKPLMDNLPTGGLWLLAAGGITYSVGVIFYIWQGLKFSHAIWHLFVLAGSVLQYLAVLLYVIPVLN